MSDLQEIAKQVQQRAAELEVPEERQPLDHKYVGQCLAANERGDGCLFASIHGEKFLFNVTPKDGQWRRWNGRVWEIDDQGLVFSSVEDVAIEYESKGKTIDELIEKADPDDENELKRLGKIKDAYTKRANRLRSKGGAEKTLFWAPIVAPDMVARESDFDRNPWLLPVKNGVIDLRTGALTQGRPEDRLTRALDVEYDPHAKCELWEQHFLPEITGDLENGERTMTEFLARVFGYALTGLTTEQHIFVFTGPGRNGKGVLFEIISGILGPYYHLVNRGMILQQRNEPSPSQTSEHLVSLLGKRLAVASETNEGQKIDGAGIKALTGGDDITARPLFSREITFAPTHKLFLQTNHLPHGLTKDFALVQRLLKIDFPYRYVNDPEAEAQKNPLMSKWFRQRDPELKKKLQEEIPGILAWLVRGCLQWQEQGLSPPSSVLASVEEHAKDEDWFGQFFAECLNAHVQNGHVDPAYKTSAAELHDALKWWWSINRDGREDRVPTKNTLGRKFSEAGYEVDRSNNKKPRLGVTLKYDIINQVEDYITSKKGGK
jgi:putative DNA primase/helicase